MHNQVDDYTQDHYQFHWDEKINAFWSSSVGLNYTYGRGFYEEYNDVWYNENISFGGDTSFDYLQIQPFTVGKPR